MRASAPGWLALASLLSFSVVPWTGAAWSAASSSSPGNSDAGETPPVVAGDSPLITLLEQELARIWADLQDEPEPPHWMAVDVVDRRALSIQATHGAASPATWSRVRLGDIDLRVGTPQLDNTHKIRDAGWFSEEPRPDLTLPYEDSPSLATTRALWRTADDAYRSAVRRLLRVRTNDDIKVAREDQSPDWSSAEPIQDIQGVPGLSIDAELWRDRLRAASAIFLEYPEVFDSNLTLDAEQEVESFVSSEGARLRYGHVRLRVSAWGATVAEDGMQLSVYDYVEVSSVDGLPDEQALQALTRGVAAQVTALRHAPLVEPYVGPAILRGRAAAVFFHEILGHRLEGHRQKDEDEGQTLADKVGQRIFPTFISVIDDPTRTRLGDTDLSGAYPYDNEGIKSRPVVAVDHGILRSFLLYRSPIQGFPTSNGHGRRQPGNAVVARQGNLMVKASETVPYLVLRQRLVDDIKKQGKPFGLIFDDISGGFTFTGRATPNAFQVSPVVVWRVFPDGRPDELVRGVDLIGTPLVAFDRITAASDQMDVFNGVCGAESGWVPVSAAAPDLLLSEVEVQRKEKDNDRPPLLPPPGLRPGGPS